MSPARRVLGVVRRELQDAARRPFYLLWTLFLVWNAYLMSRGIWFYRSVDTSVGTQVSWVTSEFQIAFVVALLSFLFLAFFVALAAGMPPVRDGEWRVDTLLHATPLTATEYAWGKLLGALGAILSSVAVFAASIVLFQYGLPDPARPEIYGPLDLGNILRPLLVFTLPAVIFVAGVAFALGTLGRRPILIFLLPAGALIFFNTFFWGWVPPDMSPGLVRFFQLVDPSGFRWLKQTWLLTDRGITFYNTHAIGYDAGFLASRLGFVALGLALVAWTGRRLRRQLHGHGHVATGQRRKASGEVPAASTGGAAKPWGKPLADLEMRSAPPSTLRGTLAVTRFELAELLHHPGLYIALPVVFLTTYIALEGAARGGLGQVAGTSAAFSPANLLTPGFAAALGLSALNLWGLLLILFFGVEALHRESATGIAEISRPTALPRAAVLLGKSIAVLAVLAGVLLAVFAASAVGVLLHGGGSSLELRPFVIVWGLLFLPTALFWWAFVHAVYGLTQRRAATWGAALALIVATVWLLADGEMTWLTNWPLLTIRVWSDLSVFELDRQALVLNRLMVLALAAALAWVGFAAESHPGGGRRGDPLDGERRPAAWVRRLWPAAIPATTAAMLAFMLWGEVHGGFQGDAARERLENYWRMNFETFRDAELPELAHVDLELDLEPAEHRFDAAGSYVLVNRTGAPLPWIPLSGGLFWEGLEWTVDGRPAAPENRAGLYLFRLDEPLAIGQTLELGFRYSGVLPKGPTRNGIAPGTFEFLLPAGVVVTARNPDFVPVVGFVGGRGVDADNRTEPRIHPPEFHLGETSGETDRSSFTHRLEIRAPAEYTVNSTGILEGVAEEDGRKIWIWISDAPLRVWNIIAGRYEVARGDHGTAVYYDPHHGTNVRTMLDALEGARRYYSEWFHPYPWEELRLSEFPAVSVYARGNATNIFFSEGLGFTTAPGGRVDLPFGIAAHEAAHSWWGHIVANGDGPGGIVISEGGAHFATLMLLEELRGENQRMRFARAIESDYGEFRRPSSEKPLVETTWHRPADAMVIYNKGAWAFWMLMRHMGHDAFLAGVQDFFRLYHLNPDHPVLQDFLAVIRPYAPDTAAYDRFTQQWFYEIAMPEYRFTRAEKRPLADACADCPHAVEITLENIGTATMPIEIAATRGRRFEPDGGVSPDYRDCRGELDLAPGESGSLTLSCAFEPERIVVDPDVHVLQLQRQAGTVRLR